MPRVYPPVGVEVEHKGKQSGASINPSLIESIAGFSAGVVSTLAVHPFDLIKTRQQIAADPDTSALSIIKKIGAEAHVTTLKNGLTLPESNRLAQAFYRGLMVNTLGNSVSWALYFMWYSNLKEMVRAARGGTELVSSDYFLASGMSGVLTSVFTNPIWVVKTRLLSTSKDDPRAYKNTADGVQKLYKQEGIRGFYRGLIPSLFGVSHGAVQFMAYENLKKHWALSRPGGKDGLTNWDYLNMSAISKMFAGTITYPYQVVRARLQMYEAPVAYKSATDVVKQVYAKDGLRGFYKGLGPNLIRVLPSTCVTFVVYENVKRFLPRYLEQFED